jgi:hypothetical protein
LPQSLGNPVVPFSNGKLGTVVRRVPAAAFGVQYYGGRLRADVGQVVIGDVGSNT